MSAPRDHFSRYARQMVLPDVGTAGQEKLTAAKILVVGAGGLGSPVLLYLAGAGVGTIGVCDGDRVETHNLHRQVLYTEQDVGQPKARAAAARIGALNPEIRVHAVDERVTADTVRAHVRAYDLVIDGTDNFSAKYLLNDACVLENKPLLMAALAPWEGMLALFNQDHGKDRGACYRCLYPVPPTEHVPSCAESGILGATAGVIGALQAQTALAFVLSGQSPLAGRLLLFDARTLSSRFLNMSKNPACPACGDTATPTLTTGDLMTMCSIQSTPAVPKIADPQFEKTFAALGDQMKNYYVIDVRPRAIFAAGHIAGSVSVPLDELPAQADHLPRDRDILIYCQRGISCQKAQKFLHDDKHMPHVYFLKEGYEALKNQGLI